MKVYTGIGSSHLADVPAAARKPEELVFDGVSFGEVSQDALLPAMLVAEHTSRMTMGTLTLAFVRSPMATASSSSARCPAKRITPPSGSSSRSSL